MSDTIVVLGANGIVGRRVAHRLLDAGHPVRIPVGNRETARPLAEAGAEIITTNILRDDPTPWFRDASAAFLMVPLHPRMEEAGLRINRAAAQQRLDRVVRLSVLTSLMEADVSFARTHRKLDEDLEGKLPGSAILRPDGFMQNLLGSAVAIRGGHLINAGGKGRTALIDADDIADCVVAMLTGSAPCHGRHDLTGPEALSFREVARHLSRTLGWPVAYVDLPVSQYRLMLQELGVPMHMVGILGELADFTREGQGGAVSTGVGGVLRRPPRSLERFIEAHRNDFISAGTPL